MPIAKHAATYDKGGGAFSKANVISLSRDDKTRELLTHRLNKTVHMDGWFCSIAASGIAC